MAVLQEIVSMPRKPIRLWPGVALVILQWLAGFVLPLVVAGTTPYALLARVLGGLLIVVWWLFFSRAAWLDRLGALVLMVVAVAASSRIVDESIATGMMGRMLPIAATPPLCLALVASAFVGRRLSDGPRRAVMAAAILLACGALALVRTGGVTGEGAADLHWRWTRTPEQRLLDRTADETAARTASTADARTAGEWPGFRGPARDGIVRGVVIRTDWSQSPPVELWRRPIGPAWSSFAVRGDVFYTQEQRGDEESVSCYRLTTGEPVWRHGDNARFWESNAGAGPRATPTLDGDSGEARVFTLGATGIVNALDADDGALVWTRDAAADTGVEVPGWGFSGSPLVVDDLVVVALAGRLAAYDKASGDLRWLGPEGGGGYSSPHLLTIDGVAQILHLRGSRTTGVSPADGTLLWEHKGEPSVSIVQPAVAADGEILISPADAMGGLGMRRLAVAHGPSGWSVEERWTSRGLKPYFSDFVVHDGHAYGFDGSLLAAIDLENGERRWKGGRYGSGQLLLLADQGVLLVLSEEGELALVEAVPDQFTELARRPAIRGKTWNHPVLAGDVLLVRNAEEMAAFRLPW